MEEFNFTQYILIFVSIVVIFATGFVKGYYKGKINTLVEYNYTIDQMLDRIAYSSGMPICYVDVERNEEKTYLVYKTGTKELILMDKDIISAGKRLKKMDPGQYYVVKNYSEIS